MNLVDMLPEHDKKLIDRYIEEYAPLDEDYITSSSRAPLNEVLYQWSNAKQRLYKMFGNKFTYVKDIEFAVNQDLICEQIRDVVCNEGAKFIQSFWNWYNDYADCLTYEQKFALTELIYTSIYYPDQLLRIERGNVCKIPTPDGKTLDIFPNSKLMKILGKLAAIFNLDGFEEFRIAHSRVLNQKSIKGQFVLSIHPLDYMTMSDNECRWDSCMSWRNGGGYRAGTVEMMNSDNVVVAYLTASRPMHLFNSGDNWDEWSNKKWRCLFIVADQFICKVKSYPFQNDDYELQMIEELATLSKENLDYEYDDEIIHWDGEGPIDYKDEIHFMDFDTGHMYNDFGTVTHFFKPHPSLNDGKRHKSFCYSGASECMWCGAVVDMECEDSLLCEDCCEHKYCSECGERLSQGRETYTDARGNIYCEYCFDNRTFEDDLTGQIYPNHEKQILYLVPSAKLIEDSADLIQNIERGRLCDAMDWLSAETITTTEEHFYTLLSEIAPKDKIHQMVSHWGWNPYTYYYIDIHDCNPDYIEENGLDDEEYQNEFNEGYIRYLKRSARFSEYYLEECNKLEENFWAEEAERKSSSESDEG